MKDLIKVAICYDFDGTLAPGNMQEYGFMKALKTTPKTFWKKSDTLSEKQSADKNLCYMYTMMDQAKAKGIPFKREDLREYGKDIKLFKGVETWFSRINAYAAENGIELQHYLLSSGLKEIVEGLPISREFTKIYACSFMYDSNGVAFAPAQVVNYTTKTQYLFRISKGCLDETDTLVNEKTPKAQRNIPFDRMLYIGDGLTDVPCMATLRKFGGRALAVYRPRTKKGSKSAQQLLDDGRVDNISPADYSEGSRLDQQVKAWLNRIKADHEMQNL